MAFVSSHANMRYRERVDPCSEAEANAAMMACAPAIDKAAEIGCSTVIMGRNGARLKLQGDVVSTVYEKRYGRVMRHG
jgi:hypothetical protein